MSSIMHLLCQEFRGAILGQFLRARHSRIVARSFVLHICTQAALPRCLSFRIPAELGDLTSMPHILALWLFAMHFGSVLPGIDLLAEGSSDIAL